MAKTDVLDAIKSKVEGSTLFDEVVVSYDYNQVNFMSKKGIFKYQFREMVNYKDDSTYWDVFSGKLIGNKWVWTTMGKNPRIPKDEKQELNNIMHYVLFEIQ